MPSNTARLPGRLLMSINTVELSRLYRKQKSNVNTAVSFFLFFPLVRLIVGKPSRWDLLRLEHWRMSSILGKTTGVVIRSCQHVVMQHFPGKEDLSQLLGFRWNDSALIDRSCYVLSRISNQLSRFVVGTKKYHISLWYKQMFRIF